VGFGQRPYLSSNHPGRHYNIRESQMIDLEHNGTDNKIGPAVNTAILPQGFVCKPYDRVTLRSYRSTKTLIQEVKTAHD
jgi:hypothetical protein